MQPDEYEFNTDEKEVMKILAGEFEVLYLAEKHANRSVVPKLFEYLKNPDLV